MLLATSTCRCRGCLQRIDQGGRQPRPFPASRSRRPGHPQSLPVDRAARPVRVHYYGVSQLIFYLPTSLCRSFTLHSGKSRLRPMKAHEALCGVAQHRNNPTAGGRQPVLESDSKPHRFPLPLAFREVQNSYCTAIHILRFAHPHDPRLFPSSRPSSLGATFGTITSYAWRVISLKGRLHSARRWTARAWPSANDPWLPLCAPLLSPVLGPAAPLLSLFDLQP
jgi:hypothetical protein